MSKERTVGQGMRVTMHMRLALADGTEVEATPEDTPLVFTVGDGTLHPAVERTFMGQHAGATGSAIITPDQAFGFRDESLRRPVPRADFAEDMPLAPGVILTFKAPGGQEVPGTILEVRDEEVQVDFNHPLAGRILDFTYEIVAVEPPEDETQADDSD